MIHHTVTTPTPLSRVVVLGSSGFIGRHLLKHYRKEGVEVLGLGSKEVNLADSDAHLRLAELIRKSDTVVFASCLTRDRGDDLQTFVKNVVMAEQVGLFMEKSGCAHLIYLSSDAVYKDGLSPVREDSECKPVGLYPMAQFARETLMAHASAKAKIPLIILRLCAIYGRGDTHNGYGPNRFVRMAAEKGKITLFGAGEETRDHLFVGDACRLIALSAAHRSTGVLDLATGESISFMACAEAVVKAYPKPTEIETTPRKTPITHRHFDVTGLIRAFPDFQFTGLEQSLKMSLSEEAEK